MIVTVKLEGRSKFNINFPIRISIRILRNFYLVSLPIIFRKTKEELKEIPEEKAEKPEPKERKSHFKDKPPEVAKFFIMLGRGILK